MSKSERPSPEYLDGFVDTHFHALQLAKRGVSVGEAVEEARALGLRLAVEAGVHPAELPDRLALLPDTPDVIRATGISPAHAAEDTGPALDLLASQLVTHPIAAIGEIGLDWYRDYAPRSDQIELFERQLEIAESHDLPVIIHNREADSSVIEALTRARLSRGGVLHCFSSDWSTATAAIDLGFYVSFAGNTTFKKSEALRDVARRIPADRLLAETDSPYLSPEPVRGVTNRPAHATFLIRHLAQIRGVDAETLAHTILENSRRLFRLS